MTNYTFVVDDLTYIYLENDSNVTIDVIVEGTLTVDTTISPDGQATALAINTVKNKVTNAKIAAFDNILNIDFTLGANLDIGYPGPNTFTRDASNVITAYDFVSQVTSAASNNSGNSWALKITSDTSKDYLFALELATTTSFISSDSATIQFTDITPPPPPPVCFAQGTRLLTQNGYKAVETLTNEDRLITTEGRSTSFTLMTMHVPCTTKKTAPYVVAAGALGENKPIGPLYFSPGHKFFLRENAWILPATGAKMGLDIKQYSVGKAVTYYHVRCENYARDVILAEGVAAESYGTTKEDYAVFKLNKQTGIYTRKEYKEPSKSLKA